MQFKEQQEALTVEGQIKNLKSINLTIDDEDFAKQFLNDVSYFRFIKAYSLGLKPKNGDYYDGVTFEQLVELYLFNANFRQILFSQIEKVEINRNKRAPFIKNFQYNYSNGDIPFYALIEIFSFGTLSKFYKNMKNTDKKAIASTYRIGYTYFESWIESIAYVRNLCAHYGRLYNSITL